MKSRFVTIVMLAGLALASGTAAADAAGEWKRLAEGEIRQARSVALDRVAALQRVEEAIARALAAARASGNGNGASAARPDREEAAVAVAAFAILERLVPESRDELESRLAITFSRIAESDEKALGAALGRRIAREVLGD